MARDQADRYEFRQRIDRAMLVLFATVIESLGWATAALLDQDLERADRVIADDRHFDARCDDLIGVIKDRLSEATVLPDELEDLIAILQMVPELERSADLAEHIAQRTHHDLGGTISPRSRGLIQAMCDVGIGMWQLTSRAYAERSRDIHFRLSEADDELDELSAALLTSGAGGGADPAVAAELALVARFYERLGDHAVNLARRVDSMAGRGRMSPLRRLSASHPRRLLAARLGEVPWVRAVLARVGPAPVTPKEGGFLELFQAAASNGRAGTEELGKMLSSLQDLEDHHQEISALERRGDQITDDVLRRLGSRLLVPYRRQDIQVLAEALDDVVDDVLAAAGLVHLTRVTQPVPEVTELADVLAVMAGETEGLLGCLRNREGIRYRADRIEALGREGDAVHRRSIVHLFSGEFDALEVVKWKDIAQALLAATKHVEQVSDIVQCMLADKRPGRNAAPSPGSWR